MAVDEVGVGGRRDVRDVGRVHPHPREHPGVGRRQRLGLAAQLVRQRPLLAVEVAAFLLQPREELVRVHEAPVGQHDHMLAVIGDRVGAGRVDDDRAVMAKLLLEPAMAVIPIGARLPDREFVGEGLTAAGCPGS